MSVDNFAILAFVDPIGIVTTPSGMEIFESQGHGSLCWTPGGSRMEWRIRSPSRRGDILLGAPPNFGSFRAAKMTPFWDPNFTPPCGQLAAPYLYAHREPGPNSKLYTQICVVVCFLGTRLCLIVSRKSQNTANLFCAGSLDGAPIITQSHRHKPCSKIEVSYSAHSQLAFDASLFFTDCSAIATATCDLRAAALLLFEAITLPPR